MTTNRIALDAMGGDFAPRAAILGALDALKEQPEISIILVGQKEAILEELQAAGVGEDTFPIVHADEVIGMADHPTKAFSHKPNSSIAVGFGLLKAGDAEGFCSAGNTGAMMVGAMFSLRTIEGIMRPAICGYVPKTDGRTGVMIDAGANADVKPEVLVQFAEIGTLYAHHVLGIESPKVGLMNLGEEEQKGTLLTQAAYQQLKTAKVNFIGNIEGRDIFNDRADVIVCDGFTGNVILKMAESMYEIMAVHVREHGGNTIPFFEKLNYEAIGGSPIVGVNGSVVIGHGVSSPRAISNMLKQTAQLAQSQLHVKISQSLNGYTVGSDTIVRGNGQ
jgi:phosphate acyltransferase